MALSVFGKKKEREQRTQICTCSGGCPAEGSGEVIDSFGGTAKKNFCMKVLGSGCKSCHEQYEYAKVAVMAMGLSAEVEYVTDMKKIMEYGVMRMPALVIDDKVVAMGKVLKTADVEKLLQDLVF